MSRNRRDRRERARGETAGPAAPQARGRWPFLLILAACVLAYANSLPGVLFWDSEVLILNNVHLRGLGHIKDILTTCVTCGAGELNNYWRPASVLVYLLQYQLWGPQPWGYHLVNLLCHAANGALLFLVLDALMGRASAAAAPGAPAAARRAAFWAALLFVLHPIQNETVNYPDHLEGMLSFLFGCATILLHLRGKTAWACAALAPCLLAKEEGVVFLPILVFVELFRAPAAAPAGPYGASGAPAGGPPAPAAGAGPPFLKRCLEAAAALWPFIALLAVYAVLHATAFNFLKLPLGELGAQKGAIGSLPIRLLTFAKALLVYFRLLLLPTGLHFDRDLSAASSLADGAAWGAAAACAAALAALWRLCREERWGRLGLLWFLSGLIPYCGLIPFNNVVAEHFLYIASAGLFLTATLLARRHLAPPRPAGLPPRPWAWAALACLGAFYLAQDWRRNADWQDPARIYKTTLAGNPGSYRAANNLGVEAFRRGDMAAARRAFEASLSANPVYPPALNNLGAVEEAQGRLEPALRYYLASAKAQPDYALAGKNAAGLLLRANRPREAEEWARRALEVHPQYPDALAILGAALFNQGRKEDALGAFEASAALDPKPETLGHLATVYDSLGLKDKARRLRESAGLPAKTR